TIDLDDSVFAQVHIIAPMEVIITETTVDVDTESEDIDTSDIGIITDHLVEARFNYTITNHLPLGVDFMLYLDGDSLQAQDSTTAQFVISGLSVDAAPTSNSLAIADTVSTGYILIDSVDVQVLKNDTLFIAPEILLHGTNGNPVRLSGQDYISITGYITVEYLFDGDF
ncbi:MAG: hypothetical protein V3T31_04695, partial [candidate division Zixibacteria bacterium]